MKNHHQQSGSGGSRRPGGPTPPLKLLRTGPRSLRRLLLRVSTAPRLPASFPYLRGVRTRIHLLPTAAGAIIQPTGLRWTLSDNGHAQILLFPN